MTNANAMMMMCLIPFSAKSVTNAGFNPTFASALQKCVCVCGKGGGGER